MNIAILFARHGRNVAIADLDVHHGQVAAHSTSSERARQLSWARDDQLPGNPPLDKRATLLIVNSSWDRD